MENIFSNPQQNSEIRLQEATGRAQSARVVLDDPMKGDLLDHYTEVMPVEKMFLAWLKEKGGKAAVDAYKALLGADTMLDICVTEHYRGNTLTDLARREMAKTRSELAKARSFLEAGGGVA